MKTLDTEKGLESSDEFARNLAESVVRERKRMNSLGEEEEPSLYYGDQYHDYPDRHSDHTDYHDIHRDTARR